MDYFLKNSVILYILEYILITFYLKNFLEGFILYKKNDIVTARLLWEIYTCIIIPIGKFKILSNFCVFWYITMTMK